jgi:hypothetical protein
MLNATSILDENEQVNLMMINSNTLQKFVACTPWEEK